jgi:hypothetical protein
MALANVRGVEDERFRWILVDGASRIIANSLTVNINQHASGGQEGNGIRERNEPFAPGDNDLPVWINHKVVTNYPKTGILVDGSVAR